MHSRTFLVGLFMFTWFITAHCCRNREEKNSTSTSLLSLLLILCINHHYCIQCSGVLAGTSSHLQARQRFSQHRWWGDNHHQYPPLTRWQFGELQRWSAGHIHVFLHFTKFFLKLCHCRFQTNQRVSVCVCVCVCVCVDGCVSVCGYVCSVWMCVCGYVCVVYGYVDVCLCVWICVCSVWICGCVCVFVRVTVCTYI